MLELVPTYTYLPTLDGALKALHLLLQFQEEHPETLIFPYFTFPGI